MTGITMKEYKQRALATMKAHESQELAIADWALGLGGELSEVVELIHNESTDKMELAKELGDVLWYAVALASELDIALPAGIFEACMTFVSDRGHCATCVVDSDPTETAMIALVINTGTIQEKIKHIMMHKENSAYNALAGQLHEVIEKLSTIGFHAGFSIDAVASLNVAKLAHRYETKNGVNYSNEASAERHATEAKFEDTVIYKDLYKIINEPDKTRWSWKKS